MLAATSAMLLPASGALAASGGRHSGPVAEGPVARGPVAEGPVAISPAPGTPDASPTTQISVLGIPPGQVRSVRVEGSSSGLHRGAFLPYSGRRGASFVLSRPLEEGEHVSVAVRFAHRPPRKFSFRVANLAAVPPVLNIPKLQPSKLDHFVTEPQLLPPRISVRKGSLAGDVFLTPLPSRRSTRRATTP